MAAAALRRAVGSGIHTTKLQQHKALNFLSGNGARFGDCRRISQLVNPNYGNLPSSFAQVRGFSAQAGIANANASGFAKLRHAASDFVSLASMAEIMADYVHHEMTRTMVLGCWRLFLLITIKDAYLSLLF